MQIHNALSEQSITGIAAGIDAQGCLLIEQADGQHTNDLDRHHSSFGFSRFILAGK
ncbi:MAG: hypothetical protein U1E91_02305 [Moraxella sp.]